MANNKSKSRRARKIILFSILAVLAVAGALGGRLLRRTPPIAIVTEKVSRRNVTEVVVANGKIEPVLQVKISPEVSGEIIELDVKEGQNVKKGDLLFKIWPDNYIAARNSAQANYKSAAANRETAKANLEKADLEYKRNDALFKNKLISESDFLTAKTTYDVAKATLDGAIEQVSIAQAQLDSAQADLSKTTVYCPLTGTVSKLNSQLGERVVGTATMAGTEVMTVADLDNMEAWVDIGEIDIPLVKLCQKASLEVDSFNEQKFSGVVTEIAESANNNDTTAAASSTASTDATKFQVRIGVTEKARFLPGMSVTANIETRYRTNVLTVPIQSVTKRLPAVTNSPAVASNSPAVAGAKGDTRGSASNSIAAKKTDESAKTVEVVFVLEGDHVKQMPVKRGISDDNYDEVTEGLKEGQEVVSGGYKAINRDLAEGTKVVVNAAAAGQDKETQTH